MKFSNNFALKSRPISDLTNQFSFLFIHRILFLLLYVEIMINFFLILHPSQESTPVLPQIFHSALTKWHSTKLIVLKLRAMFRRNFFHSIWTRQSREILETEVCVINYVHILHAHHSYLCIVVLNCAFKLNIFFCLSFFIPNFLYLVLLIISFRFLSLVNAYHILVYKCQDLTKK